MSVISCFLSMRYLRYIVILNTVVAIIFVEIVVLDCMRKEDARIAVP